MIEAWNPRKRQWEKKTKIPQGLGTRWRTGDYIHGPRVQQPDRFTKLFIKPVAWAKKRHVILVQKPKGAQKVILGVQKDKLLGVQSYLTPTGRKRPAEHPRRVRTRYGKTVKRINKGIPKRIRMPPRMLTRHQPFFIKEMMALEGDKELPRRRRQ